MLTALILATTMQATPINQSTGDMFEGAYKLIREIDIPVLYIEYFNLKDEITQEHFASKDNRAVLLENIAEGIVQYAEKNDVRCILADDGHGSVYAGALNDYASERNEYWYAEKFQKELLTLLSSDFITQEIDYHEDGLQTARIESYSQRGNSFSCPGKKLYVANHIDSNKDDIENYPHFYVTRPLEEMLEFDVEISNPEQYTSLREQSIQLAKEILKQLRK